MSEILRVEIPSDIKRSAEHRPNILNEPIKILILCQDNRTCYQLNQYLTQGFERYLFLTALKNDLSLPKISERFQTIQQSDGKSINIVDFVAAKPAVPPPSAVEKPIVKAMLKKSKEDSSGASTSRGGFLRDRIAKRKAMEEEELGKEEENSQTSKNELAMLTKDDYLGEFLFKILIPL